jgi:hypothetical protein
MRIASRKSQSSASHSSQAAPSSASLSQIELPSHRHELDRRAKSIADRTTQETASYAIVIPFLDQSELTI